MDEEKTEEVEETEETEEVEEAPEPEAEETPEPKVDELAEVKEILANIVEKLDNGFNALNSLFVDAGAVVTDYEPEEEQEEYVSLEDLDFNI